MTMSTRGAVAPTSAGADATATAAAGDSATAAPPPIDTVAFDEAVAVVADHAVAWAKTPAAQRADLLDRVIADTLAAQDEWLAAAIEAKGLPAGSTEAGEELSAGVGTFVRLARLFRDALRDIAKDGKPSFAGPIRRATDGRLRVQVFPAGAMDRITFPQTTAEVFMQPGVTEADIVSGQADAYVDPDAHAGTALVLAAGNVASLGPRDVLSKLFVEGKVVVLKANPVNDYLVPHWDRAMAALVEAGVLRIVDGGAAVGKYLTAHPAYPRGPHHRVRQDVRRRRLRHRRGGRAPQGRRRPGAGQAGHRRARQRLAGDHRAGQVVDRPSCATRPSTSRPCS